MSSPKEALNFHEAERHNIILSHSDFAKDADFEFLEENEALTDYLLLKDWDKHFIMQKNGLVTCDVVIVNQVFEHCYNDFCKKMDTVQIFSIIIDFYNIQGYIFFNKLLQLHRKRLVHDLELRIGKMKSVTNSKIGEDRMQMAFHLIFNKK